MDDYHDFYSKAPGVTPSQPFGSIIVPMWDRPRQVGACFGALAWLDPSAACLKAIVVEDGS